MTKPTPVLVFVVQNVVSGFVTAVFRTKAAAEAFRAETFGKKRQHQWQIIERELK